MRISDWSSDVCSSDLLNDLREHIDWTPFFRAWELAGVYPAILDDAIVGESARSLFADAQKMLDRMIAEKWVTAKGVAALWPCRREGDDVLIEPASGEMIRMPFLRQQIRRSEEHTSALQSLMRISYAVFCLKHKTIQHITTHLRND